MRRSSFVPPASRASAVPSALSWREHLDGSTAPKGPAAWMAASTARADRMVIDAGPYGVIDLAATEATADAGGPSQLGVVWWDKRSYREEDDDDGTIQTSFVPAPITDHISLASGSTRGMAGASRETPARAVGHAPADAPAGEPRLHPVEAAIAGPVLASPRPASSAPTEPVAAPVPASSRPVELDDSEHQRHARRSRHVALVPKTRARRRGPGETSHPRRAMLRRRRTRRRFVLGAIIVVIAFAATVIVQSAIITPFTVPSVSMQKTLDTGDRILVDKIAYGASSIHRGDVVVFSDPGGWLAGSKESASGGDGAYLVKRVIGVPGDHVSCCSTDGRLTVNGIELYEDYAVVPAGEPAAASDFEVTVPAGALWVLGDNRYNSHDSSETQGLPSKGFVPIAGVVGHAVIKFWPLDRLGPIGSARETFASVPDQTCPI